MNVIQLLSAKIPLNCEVRYVADLSKQIEAHNGSVGIITRGIEAVDRYVKEAGFIPGKLPLRGAFDLISPIRLASVYRRISGTFIVHAHSLNDAAIAIRARKLLGADANRVKIVLSLHQKVQKYKKYSADFFSSINAILFPSENIRKHFVDSVPNCKLDNIYVVPDTIVAPLPTTEICTEPGLRLMYAGEIRQDIPIKELIEAIGMLGRKDISLTIVGTGKGPIVMPLVHLSRKLSIEQQIKWVGICDDVFKYVQTIDAGIVLQNGQENPSIESAIYISQGRLLLPLTEDCSANNIARIIKNWLDNPENLRKQSEDNLQNFRDNWSYEQMYSQIESIYNDLLKS